MQITGKIIEKLPIRSGNSARGPWSIAQLVVEFQDGQYTSHLALQNMNKADEFDKLPLGATGKFDYAVSSRKSQQGTWFTSCTCFKWEIDGPSPAEDMPPV
jgi:hypothetical protein